MRNGRNAPVGVSYSRSETFRLPPAFQFHGNLFVKADADNAVDEFDFEGNNAGRAPNAFDVTPKPYADLVVRSVTPGPGAASSRPLASTPAWPPPTTTTSNRFAMLGQ